MKDKKRKQTINPSKKPSSHNKKLKSPGKGKNSNRCNNGETHGERLTVRESLRQHKYVKSIAKKFKIPNVEVYRRFIDAVSSKPFKQYVKDYAGGDPFKAIREIGNYGNRKAFNAVRAIGPLYDAKFDKETVLSAVEMVYNTKNGDPRYKKK